MRIFLGIDAMMVLLFLFIGFFFYKSKGKAANYLSGYNMKSDKEREKYDDADMCKDYGKRIMFMAVPFIVGSAIDYKFAGIGTGIAWAIWIVMFIFLLFERYKREGGSHSS